MADHYPNHIGLDAMCPLCGAGRTRFVDSWSDGDEIVERSFYSQKCKACGLPCKLWAEVERLKAERDQHREGEAALVVERDALWRRADELGREVEQLKAERDDLARALFRIRSLTMRGRGDMQVANIACDAVMHIDEGPLFPGVQ